MNPQSQLWDTTSHENCAVGRSIGRASSRFRGDEAAPAAQARAGSSGASPHPNNRYFQGNQKGKDAFRRVRVLVFGVLYGRGGTRPCLGSMWKRNPSIRVPRWFLMPLGAAVMWLLSSASQAQRASNWRIFTGADGLAESSATAISLSPRGNVWVKHADANEITVLDGYTVHTLPSPGNDNFRVYESKTGQLWSMYSDQYSGGLVLYDGQQWVRHSIPEIHAEIQSDPLRQIRQIPLIPVQQDRVLFLISSRLMEYDAARRRANVLRWTNDTSLGRFSEMSEARNGGLWVTGARGLSRVSGPLRQLSLQNEWQSYSIADQRNVENLQRPFENDEGGIITAASDTSSATRRVLLFFDGTHWKSHPVRTENIRQAWPGWDRTVWAYTINSLFRFDGDGELKVRKEESWFGQFKDVATETNGVFWLATSEGVVRYAPFAWRSPPGWGVADSLVHAVFEDAQGRLWFGGNDSLIRWQDGQWKQFPWPENFEGEFQPGDAIYGLGDGGLVIATHDRALLFDPGTERFQEVRQSGHRTRFIGKLTPGILCAQTVGGSPASARLEQFDGQHFRSLFPQFDWNTGALNVLVAAKNGDLWLGGNSGVIRYRNATPQHWCATNGFPEEHVFSLLEVSEGKIWCGGADRIIQFEGDSWSVIRGNLGRVNKMIKAREGKIWVATARGLYSYAAGSWVLNAPEDGLPSTAVAEVFEDSHARLWAGTARGASLFHPDSDVLPPKTLDPVVRYAGASSTEGAITIELHATDKWRQTATERLLFSHRLDEGSWSAYTNSTSVAFDHLGAGKHRFEVRAMDRNWNRDPNFAFTEFSILIPWFREPRVLAVLLVGVVLVMFFAGLAVNRHWQLMRSYAEVEKNIALRTRELERANQELLLSHKMKALGTLAAGIAHDFNNILSIIKGSAQIIETNLEDKDKIHTRVQRIKTVVDQGAGIVKSILGLSRVTDQDWVHCDLNALVDDTLKVLGDRFPHGVSMQYEPAPALPAILGVKELIQQMLLNLILNASEALPGEGEISVKTGQLNSLPTGLALPPNEARTFVYVAVQDSGSGIEPEILPRIFEPFFTTKALSTRRGTGLGLSMVYELAKAMGYGLKVKSAVGKGSTFTVIMPVRS